MIVENLMVGGGPILSRPRRKGCRVGPHSFNTLPMRQPNTIHQREVVRTLATGAVAHKVKLGHRDPEGEFVKINVERREVSFEAAVEIDAPLASNVIRDEKFADAQIKIGYDR